MKRFVFRLDSVLRLRAFELEKARVILAGAEAELRTRNEQLEAAARRAARGRALLDEEAGRGVDGERLGLRAMGELLGRSDLVRARRVRDDFQPVIDMARDEVRAAHTRVRSLELLREKQQEGHRRRALALEQAQLEEITLLRLAREKSLRRSGRSGERA